MENELKKMTDVKGELNCYLEEEKRNNNNEWTSEEQ